MTDICDSERRTHVPSGFSFHVGFAFIYVNFPQKAKQGHGQATVWVGYISQPFAPTLKLSGGGRYD
jgi:hypothetical protein